MYKLLFAYVLFSWTCDGKVALLSHKNKIQIPELSRLLSYRFFSTEIKLLF